MAVGRGLATVISWAAIWARESEPVGMMLIHLPLRLHRQQPLDRLQDPPPDGAAVHVAFVEQFVGALSRLGSRVVAVAPLLLAAGFGGAQGALRRRGKLPLVLAERHRLPQHAVPLDV